MIKLIGLLKKKDGMSREEFIDYYENHHAPFASQVAPMGFDYRRNYTVTMRKNGKEVEGDPEFDVVTEMWFADEAAYQTFSTAMRNPETFAKIVADEERFMDRSASRIMIVDERSSPKAD